MPSTDQTATSWVFQVDAEAFPIRQIDSLPPSRTRASADRMRYPLPSRPHPLQRTHGPPLPPIASHSGTSRRRHFPGCLIVIWDGDSRNGPNGHIPRGGNGSGVHQRHVCSSLGIILLFDVTIASSINLQRPDRDFSLDNGSEVCLSNVDHC